MCGGGDPTEHPWFAAYLTTRDPRTTRLSDHFTQPELRRSPYYIDFYRPRGLRFGLYTMIVTTGRTAIAVGTGRGRSDFTYAQRDLVEALRPPLGAVWRHVTQPQVAAPRGSARTFPSLTPAEQQVARLVVTGLSNREIAAVKGVTVKAIEQHLTHVYRKLDVASRSQLIASALFGSSAC